MNSFSYLVPTKVIFGKDALTHLYSEINVYSPKKVLVLYGSGSVVKSGILSQVTNILDDKNIAYISIGGVQANPILSFANETRDIAVNEGVDFILAVGGGSVIDTAKAIAHGIKLSDNNIWDIWTKKVEITSSVPVATILTISAAGSETSNSAVLTNSDISEKRGFSTPFNRPKFSLLNPEFTFSLPKYQVACGVVDILMHTLDRYFAADSNNEITSQIAEAILRTAFKYGKIAVNDPTNYEAMSELMWTGSLSHNDISGLGAIKDFSPHQLSHEISGLYGVAHGAALCLTWNGFANYIYKEKPDRFVRFAKNVFGFDGDNEIELAKKSIDEVISYFKSMEMPTTFNELLGRHLTSEEIETLAQSCSFAKTRVIGSLRPLDFDDMKAIYTWLNS